DNVIPHEPRFGDRFLTKFAFNSVDYFIVQSDSVREDLLRIRPGSRYGEVRHPIYNIFDKRFSKREARRKLGISGERVALFFGYVRNYKGLEYLIRAMPAVLRRVDLILIVAGDFYEGRDEYFRLVSDLDLNENVVIVDKFIPDGDVGLYFSCADVVVLPYISATQSGIIQIAYHFDLPVITTDVGGLSEIVINGKSGLIVAPGDTDALADALIRFYEENMESKLIEGVRCEKLKYSWDRLIGEIEKFAAAQPD
ncbi:MAG: glycosyltransferase family 4 protein, partial [Fidelibacterota bacterium]